MCSGNAISVKVGADRRRQTLERQFWGLGNGMELLWSESGGVGGCIQLKGRWSCGSEMDGGWHRHRHRVWVGLGREGVSGKQAKM